VVIVVVLILVLLFIIGPFHGIAEQFRGGGGGHGGGGHGGGGRGGGRGWGGGRGRGRGWGGYGGSWGGGYGGWGYPWYGYYDDYPLYDSVSSPGILWCGVTRSDGPTCSPTETEAVAGPQNGIMSCPAGYVDNGFKAYGTASKRVCLSSM
jgi:hypothetical protein